MEIMTQRIELLAISPGESPSGEKTVVLTIRPDRGRWRPHNVALSRSQAIRLLKSLRIVLRQSAGIVLLSVVLASATGCSTRVEVTKEETGPKTTTAEAAPPATEQRTTTAVAVDMFGGGKPKPAEERPSVKEPAAAAPPPEPKKPVEIVGSGNSVVVVEGDLHVHQHRHLHIQEPSRSERVEIEIRRYDVERFERCERLRREYEAKVRQLQWFFYESGK